VQAVVVDGVLRLEVLVAPVEVAQDQIPPQQPLEPLTQAAAEVITLLVVPVL
jgi:hypothetical protein